VERRGGDKRRRQEEGEEREERRGGGGGGGGGGEKGAKGQKGHGATSRAAGRRRRADLHARFHTCIYIHIDIAVLVSSAGAPAASKYAASTLYWCRDYYPCY
jgi:hypothetical protein